MPARAKSICRRPGCNALIDKPGFCETHTPDKRANFKRLDERKNPEQITFYNSTAWKNARDRHRRSEPLCRHCKQRGIVKAGEMVHHEPDREVLLDG